MRRAWRGPSLALLAAACSREPTPSPGLESTAKADAIDRVEAAAPIPGADGVVPERVTFTEHVAPLVHARCASCHRPGQVAPFSLLDEGDVRDHAEQIVEVTRSRYMPPWKPASGPDQPAFAGDRSLTDAQIALLARWVEQGAATGPESARPSPPQFESGWLLGEPDLVVELEQAYTLAAEGLDVYRNFVLPSPLAGPTTKPAWVHAWELDPGNARVVHHAILSVDRGGWAVAEDAADPEPGFEAMELRGAGSPGGFYLVWAPGTTPTETSHDAAWPLTPATNLILQLHLQPTGKPEQVQPRVGLHLSPRPPTHRGITLRVGDTPIDIPPGEASYAIEDRVELAADVELLSVFPHAHYLGRTFESRATTPDGEVRWLLRIDDWDFAWQDQYRYREPIALPAGTVIDLRVTYDNSAQNPRNPHTPPRRVQTGPNSTDEMGNVTFELMPRNDAGLLALREAKYRRALAREPSAQDHYNLANVLRDRGDLDGAIAQYEAGLALDPDHPWTLHNLSMVLMSLGRNDEAVAHARREAEVMVGSAAAHNNLGNALRSAGRDDEAIAAFQRALELDPSFELARNNLRILSSPGAGGR